MIKSIVEGVIMIGRRKFLTKAFKAIVGGTLVLPYILEAAYPFSIDSTIDLPLHLESDDGDESSWVVPEGPGKEAQDKLMWEMHERLGTKNPITGYRFVLNVQTKFPLRFLCGQPCCLKEG